eukprot:4076389-Ditylum_brightwellii.AAC.1
MWVPILHKEKDDFIHQAQKDLLDDDGNVKVATVNGAKNIGNEATPTTMRMRQREWDDASAGAKMTKEELNNKQPQRQK